MNDLNIRYETGSMVIHMDYFFPTSEVRLKKLLKIIHLDWQHETELKEILKDYFQNKISEHENLRQAAARDHLNWRQKEADARSIIATRRKPNGVPLTKDELNKMKGDLRFYTAKSKSSLSDFNKYKRAKEQFQKHIELL